MTSEANKVISFLAEEASKHIAEHPYMFILTLARKPHPSGWGGGIANPPFN